MFEPESEEDTELEEKEPVNKGWILAFLNSNHFLFYLILIKLLVRYN